MNPTLITSADSQLFEDRILDNEGFFNTLQKGMEQELPSILSNADIRQQTRLELQRFVADMKKKEFIQGVTEWTAGEQKSFFQKVQEEIGGFGQLASEKIREKIQSLIEDEVWREINDNGRKYSLQDGSGNVMIQNMGEYQQFLDKSFLTSQETSVIPLELKLTISQNATIEDAEKTLRKYHGKYNALILVNSKNHPIGIIKADTLVEYKKSGHTTVENIACISHVFGYYTTPTNEAKKFMEDNGINILPIVDSNNQILIGILTSNSLIKKEVQYYSATSLTELSLDYLKMST